MNPVNLMNKDNSRALSKGSGVVLYALLMSVSVVLALFLAVMLG